MGRVRGRPPARSPGPGARHRAVAQDVAHRAAGVALAVGLGVGGGASALAGHSLGHYPSYYPDEIRIDTIDPAAAARGLRDGTLHAYVGETPDFGGRIPDHVEAVSSLESFLVLSLDGAAPSFASQGRRCAAARGILAALRDAKAPGFVFHPYPVTPYHADYVHHLDRVADARQAVASGDLELVPAPLKVRAEGPVAEALVRAFAADDADVALTEVPVADLIADVGSHRNDGLGPPWVKEGWFQAHRLLTRPSARLTTDEIVQDHARLLRGEVLNLAERANLERRLVQALTSGCERMVVGYTVKQEYANGTFADGVENIAFDSQSGLNAPVFLRTVKLKAYPWNGSVHLGVPGRPEAAWNPVAGFTDASGRLIWSAVGDPALIPYPFNASWLPNRVDFDVTATRGQSGGIRVAADAVIPEPGSCALAPVGAWAFASAKVLYEVLASPFQDGTEMTTADLVYPYLFACRWGGPGGKAHEPRLQAASADLRARLVGLKAVRVEKTVNSIAPGFDVVQYTPVLEVYLRDAPGDEHQVAALAPPWSTVPWHLLALMEAAVQRGHAAFSQEEARRRQTSWLDLVRDPSLGARFLDLIAAFEREGYRPAALQDLVSDEEARHRWRALRTFGEANGHFLVTNGPYRLKAWTPDSVVLEAVREATYPLGFGTFDRYVHPPRAVIREVTEDSGRIVLHADAEMTVKAERSYRVERQPLTRQTSHGLFGLLVVSRYLLIGPDGTVLEADRMEWEDDGRFAIDLPQGLQPGTYTVILAILLDGNSVHPPAELLRFRVGGQTSSG
jgi:hypothetical protein